MTLLILLMDVIKGEFMYRGKQLSTLLVALGALFVLGACGEKTEEKRKTTFENPVDTYMDSRIDAMQNAKAVVNESNKRTKEQEKAMDALVK